MRQAVSEARDRPWVNHGTIETVYSSWWLTLNVDRVEKPDGSVVEHEVVIGPDAAGMVVVDDQRGVLMIWRHRFMPGTWGWEIPGGAVEDGEDPEAAARRECLEETGWEVTGTVQHLSRHHPSCGLVKQTFDLYVANAARQRGEPEDPNEARRVAWRSFDQVAADLSDGMISDGFTQLAVALTLGRAGCGHLLGRSRHET